MKVGGGGAAGSSAVLLGQRQGVAVTGDGTASR